MITKIDNSQLLGQLRAMAQQVNNGAATQESYNGLNMPIQGVRRSEGGDFSSLLAKSINRIDAMQQSSSNLAEAFEMGDPNVTLPEVMMAKAKAGIAFEGMVQVRNKMVDAYQEIMRMQV